MLLYLVSLYLTSRVCDYTRQYLMYAELENFSKSFAKITTQSLTVIDVRLSLFVDLNLNSEICYKSDQFRWIYMYWRYA